MGTPQSGLQARGMGSMTSQASLGRGFSKFSREGKAVTANTQGSWGGGRQGHTIQEGGPG